MEHRRHIFTHPSPVEHWRHLVEIVALIVAAIWGFYVFIYQERIKPAAEAPNLDFRIDFAHEKLIHNKELATTIVTWKNRGDITAQVDGFIVNIYGINYASTSNRLTESIPVGVQPSADPNVVLPGRFTRSLTEKATLIDAWFQPWHPVGGRLYGTLWTEDSLVKPLPTILKSGAYEAIVVRTTFCYRRRDDDRSFRFKASRRADGGFDEDAFRAAVHRAIPGGRCASDAVTEAL